MGTAFGVLELGIAELGTKSANPEAGEAAAAPHSLNREQGQHSCPQQLLTASPQTLPKSFPF